MEGMNLLDTVGAADFSAEECRAREVIAALNIIRQAQAEGLNLRALSKTLDYLARNHFTGRAARLYDVVDVS